jgi:hypothetical protein
MAGLIKKGIKKISFGVLAIEIVGIVFAVLFALAVDEWRQEREKDELAQMAMANVLREVESNRKELTDNLILNEKRLSSLEALRDKMSREDVDFSEINAQWSVSLPVLRATAWDSVILTNSMTRLGLESIELLSRIYGLQQDLDDYGDTLIRNFGNLTGRLTTEESVAVTVHYINLSALVSISRSLVKHYEEYEDFVGNRGLGVTKN